MKHPHADSATQIWWTSFEARLIDEAGISLDDHDKDGVEFVRLYGLQMSRTLRFAEVSADHFDVVDASISNAALSFADAWWGSLSGGADIDGLEWIDRLSPTIDLGLHQRSLYSHVTNLSEELLRAVGTVAGSWQILFSWFLSELNRLDGGVMSPRGTWSTADWFSDYLLKDVQMAFEVNPDDIRLWSVASADEIWARVFPNQA